LYFTLLICALCQNDEIHSIQLEEWRLGSGSPSSQQGKSK